MLISVLHFKSIAMVTNVLDNWLIQYGPDNSINLKEIW